jgi:hypothetical protein
LQGADILSQEKGRSMTDLSEDRKNLIRQSCLATFNRYMINADHHIDRFTEVFTGDVVWIRPSGTMVGHAEMQAFMDQGQAARQKENPPHGHLTRHLLTTSHIEVTSAHQADGIFYALVFRDEGFAGELPVAMNMPELLVEYRSRFVDTAQGWLIAEHHAQHVFRR